LERAGLPARPAAAPDLRCSLEPAHAQVLTPRADFSLRSKPDFVQPLGLARFARGSHNTDILASFFQQQIIMQKYLCVCVCACDFIVLRVFAWQKKLKKVEGKLVASWRNSLRNKIYILDKPRINILIKSGMELKQTKSGMLVRCGWVGVTVGSKWCAHFDNTLR